MKLQADILMLMNVCIELTMPLWMEEWKSGKDFEIVAGGDGNNGVVLAESSGRIP